MAGGSMHTCALDLQGTVYCWGQNLFGCLGNGSFASQSIPAAAAVLGGTSARMLQVGTAYGCAAQTGGTLICWGGNTDGRLGDGTADDRAVATVVSGIGNGVQVSGRHSHTCAVDMNRRIWCWGGGSEGQLGDGTTVTAALAPVLVVDPYAP